MSNRLAYAVVAFAALIYILVMISKGRFLDPPKCRKCALDLPDSLGLHKSEVSHERAETEAQKGSPTPMSDQPGTTSTGHDYNCAVWSRSIASCTCSALKDTTIQQLREALTQQERALAAAGIVDERDSLSWVFRPGRISVASSGGATKARRLEELLKQVAYVVDDLARKRDNAEAALTQAEQALAERITDYSVQVQRAEWAEAALAAMTQERDLFKARLEAGYVTNSYIVGRGGDETTFGPGGIPTLHRYAIVPLEQYEHASHVDRVREMLAAQIEKGQG